MDTKRRLKGEIKRVEQFQAHSACPIIVDKISENMGSITGFLKGPKTSAHNNKWISFQLIIPYDYPMIEPTLIIPGISHSKFVKDVFCGYANNWSPAISLISFFVLIQALLAEENETQHYIYHRYIDWSPNRHKYFRSKSLISDMDLYFFLWVGKYLKLPTDIWYVVMKFVIPVVRSEW